VCSAYGKAREVPEKAREGKLVPLLQMQLGKSSCCTYYERSKWRLCRRNADKSKFLILKMPSDHRAITQQRALE